MGGGGRGKAGEVVFASGVCAKAAKVQICPKTFVHDFKYTYHCLVSVFDAMDLSSKRFVITPAVLRSIVAILRLNFLSPQDSVRG